MRLILFFIIFSAINAANAQIYCKGKLLNIAQIINQKIDVLNELYNGENFRVYDGEVCGVEDTRQICFYGEDFLAAKQLTEYFQHAYQYDDGINGLFVKFKTGDVNNVELLYKEQGAQYSFTINRCSY